MAHPQRCPPGDAYFDWLAERNRKIAASAAVLISASPDLPKWNWILYNHSDAYANKGSTQLERSGWAPHFMLTQLSGNMQPFLISFPWIIAESKHRFRLYKADTSFYVRRIMESKKISKIADFLARQDRNLIWTPKRFQPNPTTPHKMYDHSRWWHSPSGPFRVRPRAIMRYDGHGRFDYDTQSPGAGLWWIFQIRRCGLSQIAVKGDRYLNMAGRWWWRDPEGLVEWAHDLPQFKLVVQSEAKVIKWLMKNTDPQTLIK